MTSKAFCALFIYKITNRHNCFNYIKRLLPGDKVKQLDWLLTLRCRRAKLMKKIEFDRLCIKYGIYTSRLRKQLKKNHLSATPNVCQDFLQTELCNDLELLKGIDDSINQVASVLHSLDLIGLFKFHKMSKFVVNQTLKRCVAKYQRLRDACAPIFPEDMEKRIINLSSLTLSTTQKQALCLGLNFCVPPRRTEQIRINAEFESLFQQLQDVCHSTSEDLSVFKAKLVSLASTYGSARIERSCLLPCHIDELIDLKKNPNIVILKPDKGSGVVIMDKHDYVDKVNSILSDQTKFQVDQCQKDQSANIAKSISDTLLKLKRKQVISDYTYKELTTSSNGIPRLYGLPKTHKSNVPVRPILSMTKTVYENVSKWLASLLKPVERCFSNFCVKDSFTFAESIRGIDSSATSMMSFDVSALFTNVPVSETIRLIVDTVRKCPNLCGIPADILSELLYKCSSNVQFLFDGQFYRQVDGVAMGSALGPLFANIFMGNLESSLSSHIDSLCHVYYRYVDDTFALVRSREAGESLLDIFNSFHPHINFTYECEEQGRLPFLDVSIQRMPDGKLCTTVHRKPTFSGVYMSFHSFVPIAYKRGLVRSLFIRALRICSDEMLDQEFNTIRAILKSNAYPEHFIDQYKVTEINNVSVATAERKAVYVNLPFYGDKSSLFIRKSIDELLAKFAPAAKPIIIFKTNCIPVASPKDRLPVAATSSVIYSFRCGCGSTYIGRTSRPLTVRAREHIPRWFLNGHLGISRSAITEHVLSCCSVPNDPISKFEIVCHAYNDRILRILEALFIRRDNPNLCKQKDHVINLRLPW